MSTQAGLFLKTSLALKQGFTTPAGREALIGGFSAQLVIAGTPAGSIFLQLQDAAGVMIKNTEVKTIASIGGQFHGIIPFEIEIYLARATQYFVALGHSGYTFGSSDYVAWLTSYGMNFNQLGYEDASGAGTYPLDLRFWEKKTVTKGTYP